MEVDDFLSYVAVPSLSRLPGEFAAGVPKVGDVDGIGKFFERIIVPYHSHNHWYLLSKICLTSSVVCTRPARC